MRKTNLVSLLIIAITLSWFISCAYANIYTFWAPPEPNHDLYDLEHGKAYIWGIGQSLQPNEVITRASLFFNDINDWQIENDDILYVHLLNHAPLGLTIRNDNQQGDYFDGRGRLLFTWTDDNEIGEDNPAEDYRYRFTRNDIKKLNLFIEDGNFGFGFDPDCHFYNNGIRFRFVTQAVPEPASLSLLGLGLLGLFGLRKRKIT